jgi:hypothetical protein
MYNSGLQRILAILLTAVFSLPLISPLLSASPDQQLPACCRKDGKHACAMRKAAPAPANGPAVSAVKPACPLYPAPAPSFSSTSSLAPPALLAGSAAVRSSGQFLANAEHHAHSAIGHSVPKRGPPAA